MSSRQNQLKWHSQWLSRRLRRLVCSKLYRDSNRDLHKSILVAGTARSGTTWLASIIASQIPCRIMFEPFHAILVKDFRSFHYFHYMRPTEENQQLEDYCQNIFTGSIRHKWIDRQVDRLSSEYRLIKAIRANLFLKWLHNAFPEVPLLFIIRHPCAVVLSRMKLNWATDTDIEPFLAQNQLIEDVLGDKLDIIKGAKSTEEKHAVIWCISNLVPLKQFLPGELPVILYENLCCQPEIEIPKIFRALKQPYQDSVFTNLDKPSTTTLGSSAIIQGLNKVNHWQKKLSSNQVRRILAIVEQFELDYIYGDSVMPLVKF